MMDRDRKVFFLSGSVQLPLKTGERSVIFHSGGITRTSAVEAIRQVAEDMIVFETQNSTYCVAPRFVPGPTSMSAKIPACA